MTSRDVRDRIVGALCTLSAEQRAVIRRAYFLRWTTERTAADLRITEDAVKTALHQALRRLTVALDENR